MRQPSRRKSSYDQVKESETSQFPSLEVEAKESQYVCRGSHANPCRLCG